MYNKIKSKWKRMMDAQQNKNSDKESTVAIASYCITIVSREVAIDVNSLTF